MKKAKIVLYIGAVLFAIYAIGNFLMGFSTYAEYIEYYGFGQVFPTIAELFFGSAGWAFLLFGLGAICGHFAKQEELLDSIDVVEEEGDFEMIPDTDKVEEEVADEDAAEEEVEAAAADAAEQEAAPAVELAEEPAAEAAEDAAASAGEPEEKQA